MCDGLNCCQINWVGLGEFHISHMPGCLRFCLSYQGKSVNSTSSDASLNLRQGGRGCQFVLYKLIWLAYCEVTIRVSAFKPSTVHALFLKFFSMQYKKDMRFSILSICMRLKLTEWSVKFIHIVLNLAWFTQIPFLIVFSESFSLSISSESLIPLCSLDCRSLPINSKSSVYASFSNWRTWCILSYGEMSPDKGNLLLLSSSQTMMLKSIGTSGLMGELLYFDACFSLWCRFHNYCENLVLILCQLPLG